MDIYVRDANAFRKVTNLWVHDGSVNRNIASAWVHDGTDWRQVYFKFTPGFQPTLGGSWTGRYYADNIAWVISYLSFFTDGSARVRWEYQYHNGSGVYVGGVQSMQYYGKWGSPLSAGEGVNYYLKLVPTATPSGLSGPTTSTWNQLNTTLTWQFGLYGGVFSYSLYLSTSASDAGIVATGGETITTNFLFE
jgi:hypothetical protein